MCRSAKEARKPFGEGKLQSCSSTRSKADYEIGFATNFNPSKSVHDFVFRPWVEILGCVQTPSTKKSMLNHVLVG